MERLAELASAPPPTARLAAAVLLVPLSVLVAVRGHARALQTVLVGALLTALGMTFLVLEMVYFAATPLRIVRRWYGPSPLEADKAAALAAGKADVETRKIVVFDGVCVLCNTSGRFVVRHLPDPNLVSFVPFQDALSNPHVSLARLKTEFPGLEEERLTERVCVVSGRRILWGADAIMEICSWMYLPFPLVRFVGALVPRPLRDLVYMTVSKNRYDWFGTQPLDANFSKSLCPYLAVKNYLRAGDDGGRSKNE